MLSTRLPTVYEVVSERRHLLGLSDPSQGQSRPTGSVDMKAKQRRELNRLLQEHAPFEDTDEMREYLRSRYEEKQEEMRLRRERRERERYEETI